MKFCLGDYTSFVFFGFFTRLNSLLTQITTTSISTQALSKSVSTACTSNQIDGIELLTAIGISSETDWESEKGEMSEKFIIENFMNVQSWRNQINCQKFQ